MPAATLPRSSIPSSACQMMSNLLGGTLSPSLYMLLDKAAEDLEQMAALAGILQKAS